LHVVLHQICSKDLVVLEVVVANLKPAAMRGITSQAMVLAATHLDSGKVRLLVAVCWNG
jgi:tRNA-binding EMAP/Myf-like protein